MNRPKIQTKETRPLSSNILMKQINKEKVEHVEDSKCIYFLNIFLKKEKNSFKKNSENWTRCKKCKEK